MVANQQKASTRFFKKKNFLQDFLPYRSRRRGLHVAWRMILISIVVFAQIKSMMCSFIVFPKPYSYLGLWNSFLKVIHRRFLILGNFEHRINAATSFAFNAALKTLVITRVFDKQLRIKSSDIKEWRFDGSMPSFSNSNKIRYVSSLYNKDSVKTLVPF